LQARRQVTVPHLGVLLDPAQAMAAVSRPIPNAAEFFSVWREPHHVSRTPRLGRWHVPDNNLPINFPGPARRGSPKAVSKNVVRLLFGQEGGAGLSVTFAGLNVFIVGIEVLGHVAPPNEHTDANDKQADQTSHEDRPEDRGGGVYVCFQRRCSPRLEKTAENRHRD